MVEPHITLVTVQQAGKANEGKKIKLSKSLFRQVLEAHPFVEKTEPNSPATFVKLLCEWYFASLADTTTQGQLFGFVNYFWPNCLSSLYYTRNDDDNAGKLLLERFGNRATADYAYDDARHVLWLKPNQELRRCYMSQDLLAILGQQNIPQLFLGSVLFG